MDKQLKDYLHYYIGQKVQDSRSIPLTLTGTLLDDIRRKNFDVKIQLRKLSSMTEAEMKAVCKIFEFPAHEVYLQDDCVWARNRNTKERLKIRFDLSQYFGLHVWEEFTLESKKIMLPLDKTLLVMHYLLSCGFDLFGLCDAGLAIDKSTI